MLSFFLAAALTATLDVQIERCHERAPLDISVGLRTENEPKWVDARHLGADESSATFTRLDRGTYVVLVRGAEPMQRATANVNLGSGDTRRVSIALRPGRIRARVFAGGKPLRNAKLDFDSDDAPWDATVTTDENGRIFTPVWDAGKFVVRLRRLPGAGSVLHRVTLQPDGTEVRIELPDHVLYGIVADRDGTPVANAAVVLATKAEGHRVVVRTKSNAKGAFAFEGVESGVSELRAVARDRLIDHPVPVTIAPDELMHLADVVVDEGFARDVVVTWNDGSPAKEAEIVCLSGERLRAKSYTDGEGRASIATPRDQGAIIYVLPREGSFAVQRLRAPIDETSTSALNVTVPRATASLELSALTTGGAPIDDVAFLMRVNGELVPPPIVRELERSSGLALHTGKDGRTNLDHLSPGVYEFWPYRTDDELAGLIETAGVIAAPININVTTGENRAAIRFRSR